MKELPRCGNPQALRELRLVPEDKLGEDVSARYDETLGRRGDPEVVRVRRVRPRESGPDLALGSGRSRLTVQEVR
jgi:hypothetical protein